MNLPLICPHCQAPLIHQDRDFFCVNNHHFDQAKQGYVNLFPTQKKSHGDDAMMIEARHRFLNQGHYTPLLEKIIEIIQSLSPQLIVDGGCGEGYYTQAIQRATQAPMIAVDLSKKALTHLQNKNIQSVIASINQIPLADNSIDMMVNIFAPIYPQEIHRLLKHDGYCLLVYAGEKHLLELKQNLYSEVRLNPPMRFNRDGFETVMETSLQFTMSLDHQALNDLITMTPYTYKTKREDLERVKALSHLETRTEFTICLLKKS